MFFRPRIFLLILLSTLWKRRLDSAVDREKRQNIGKKQALLSLGFSLGLFIAHWQGHVSFTIWKLCHAVFHGHYSRVSISLYEKNYWSEARRRKSGISGKGKKKSFYTFNQLFLRILFKLSLPPSFFLICICQQLTNCIAKETFLFLHTLLGNTENLDLLGLFPNNMLQIKKQFWT